jgi:two-component system sensor histidine kinase YesM
MAKIIPKETIIGNIITQFIGNCVIILVIFVLGIFILFYLINKITRSIEDLAGIMRNYQWGIEYNNPLLAQRVDEIGFLYTSFEKMNKKINQLIESEYQSQIQEKQARLEALQAQLDPHFLYNTLQTISGIAIEKNVPEIEQINNSLSNILRYSLNKNKTIVTVSNELQNLKDYMEIQKYRYGERINLICHLSDHVLDCKIPVFALQLVVENSIRHGSEKKIGVENIVVYDETEENNRSLIIKDNGSGIEERRLSEIRDMLDKKGKNGGEGYDQKGLINLHERLKQHFGECYGVEIANNDDEGTIVKIKIPL